MPGKATCPGRRLEQHEPERVDVRGGLGVAALGDLGGEVGRGAGRARALGRADDRRDAEVRELGADPVIRPVVEQQDVRRLQIAVQVALLVHVVQRVGHLGPERRDLRRRQRASPQPLPQVVSGHPLHDEVDARTVRIGRVDTRVEQRGQPVVVQPAEQPRLRLLQPERLRGLRSRGEDLDRDRAAEQQVRRAVDGRRAAAADHGCDGVPVVQHRGRQGVVRPRSRRIGCARALLGEQRNPSDATSCREQ